MRVVNGTRICRICTSPYRGEIEHLLTTTTPAPEIAATYARKLDCTKDQLYFSMRAHIKNRHAPQKMVIMTKEQGADMVTVEKLADSLLQLGARMVEEHPEKIRMGDVFLAQKVLIEKQKLKHGEAGIMIEMAKMFGGFGGPTDVIEGEEVDETKQ